VALGDRFILTFASILLSNPQPNITWTTPSGQQLESSNSRITSIANESAAVLEFNHTTLEDSGVWKCRILVEGTDVRGPEGTVTPRIEVGNETILVNVAVVGKIMHGSF
jgi:hypothetical protein